MCGIERSGNKLKKIYDIIEYNAPLLGTFCEYLSKIPVTKKNGQNKNDAETIQSLINFLKLLQAPVKDESLTQQQK